ncbi:hypothetical protein [Streptomyces sp. NBC_01589]|uniref:hypothetical protein n=1 Tax=unclassified Streptomyces TaxID=2593676 RepID=UPI00386A7386
MGAYLADRYRAAAEPAVTASASGWRRVIAVDGKALKGSARLTSARRHLLSAVALAPRADAFSAGEMR